MRYQTGSKYFFGAIPGYVGHDNDFAEFVDDASARVYRLKEADCEVFVMKRLPLEDIISFDLIGGMSCICKYLVPEIAAEMGFTVDMLPQVLPMRQRLRPRYAYLGVIYDAYVANGSFTLTEAQRAEAYRVYKEARGL